MQIEKFIQLHRERFNAHFHRSADSRFVLFSLINDHGFQITTFPRLSLNFFDVRSQIQIVLTLH